MTEKCAICDKEITLEDQINAPDHPECCDEHGFITMCDEHFWFWYRHSDEDFAGCIIEWFKNKTWKTTAKSDSKRLFSEVTNEVLNDPSLRASKDRRIKQLRGANKDRKRRTM